MIDTDLADIAELLFRQWKQADQEMEALAHERPNGRRDWADGHADRLCTAVRESLRWRAVRRAFLAEHGEAAKRGLR